MLQLKSMKIGQKARIVKLLKGDAHYRERLIALGLLPGTELVVQHIAPLGDPVEILVRGMALILRKEEADILVLERVEAHETILAPEKMLFERSVEPANH